MIRPLTVTLWGDYTGRREFTIQVPLQFAGQGLEDNRDMFLENFRKQSFEIDVVRILFMRQRSGQSL